MEDSVNFYDNKSLEDYIHKIRTEINNGLEDLRKRDSNFSRILSEEESRFWNIIKNNFRNYSQDTSEEKVKRLCNLIAIYNCLTSISYANYCVRNETNNIKSLLNKE